MDPQDAPTVEVLWDRSHKAVKAGRICNMCKRQVAPGERYRTTGMRVDGVFEIWFRHENGERYPSGCPTLRERDLAEMSETPNA